MKSFYEETLSGMLRDLRGQTGADLHDLFKVLNVAAHYAATGDYASRSIYVRSMGDVLDELGRRRIQRADEVESYYEHLITRRDFMSVNKLRGRFPGIDLWRYQAFSVVGGVDAAEPAAYELGRDGRLQLSRISLPEDGNYVVIVIGCHFAVDAARVLMADGAVADLLASKRVLWLLSDAELDKVALEEWNNHFPRFSARIAYDNATWTGVDFTATPTFNYFRNGALVESVAGWDSKDGQMAVTQSLARLGLLKGGAAPASGVARP